MFLRFPYGFLCSLLENLRKIETLDENLAFLITPTHRTSLALKMSTTFTVGTLGHETEGPGDECSPNRRPNEVPG